MLVVTTAAGRRLAADGGPPIESRYAKVLVLSATLTAAMVVGLLAFATTARADVDCHGNYCLEKAATPDPATVGEPLTKTAHRRKLNRQGAEGRPGFQALP